MQFLETDEFAKDIKKLKKKYRTIEDDLSVLKKAIAAEPLGDGTKHWNVITRVEGKEIAFLKVRMSCRSMNKGADFRVVYMHDGAQRSLLFIEIYFKGNEVNNDMMRIEQVIKEIV